MTKQTLVVAILFSLILSACISTSSEPEIVQTRIVPSSVPQAAPVSLDFLAGASLYTANCAPCHGETGLGDGPSASGFTCEMPAFTSRDQAETLESYAETAINGRRTSDTCIMPPWTSRLTIEQIWDAAAYAYNLRFSADQVAQGATLLSERRNDDPVASYLSDVEWQAGSNDLELMTLVTNNNLPGYDLAAALSAEEQTAMVAYLRSMMFEGGITEVAVAQPEPISTEEPGDAPASISTGEPSEVTTPVASISDTLTVSGIVFNGTAGAIVPDDLEITIRLAVIGTSGSPETIYTEQITVNADGGYVFENVPRNDRSLGLVFTNHAGIAQFSQEFFPGAIEGDVVDVPFTIYETTDDPSSIVIDYIESLVDAVSAEGASQTFQAIDASNVSDKIYIGGEQGTFQIPLPDGAAVPEIYMLRQSENGQELFPADDQFQLVQEDGHFTYYDSQFAPPGPQPRIVLSYNHAYDGWMQIEQNFPYAIEEVNVLVYAQRGLDFESDQLTFTGVQDFNGIPYDGYSYATGTFPAEETLVYVIADGPDTVQPDIAGATASAASSSSNNSDESFFQANTNLILGVGVLLVVLGGMFLFYDLQKTRILAAQNANSPTNGKLTKQTIVAEIAALDEAYESGELDESTYEQEREVLKKQLRKMI